MAQWRDILVVTGGSSPQIVTETLYALLRRGERPFVPNKIICAITQGVQEAFGTELEAALEALRRNFGLKVDWSRHDQVWQQCKVGCFVEYPRNAEGQPVWDVRSDADATLYGNFISEIVRIETLDPSSRLHLSIGGGRRTMSFYGGAAMSLFGRSQDELSHVLVNPPDFERCADFWFPSSSRRLVHHDDGRRLDASVAKIELTIIPFLRVRARLPRTLLTQNMDYAGHVAQANAVIGRTPLMLELVTSERRVRIGTLADFTLPNTEFALYQLMAEWKLHGNSGASPSGIGLSQRGWLTALMFRNPEKYHPNPVERFLEIYADTFKTSTDQADDMSNTITAHPTNEKQRKTNENSFAQWKARLISALRRQLHETDLADRFGAPLTPVKVQLEVDGSRRSRIVFGVKLEPQEIALRVE
jgi:CRISPR-associated protein (TIGR02584 family)